MNENSDLKDSAEVKIPPPLLYFGFAILGIGVDYILPAPIGLPKFTIYIGIAISILSLGFIAYVARLFRNAGTTSNPTGSVKMIVSSGPFAYSRNPIYTAACGIPIGLGLVFNNFYTLLAFIPAVALVYATAIVKEEKYLERKFGDEYLDYKARVRRWI